MAQAAVAPADDGQSDFAGAAKAFVELAERALGTGGARSVSSSDLEHVMTAAVKLYAAKGDADGSFPPPVSADRITPTEVVLVVTEMMRAADLNLFDLAMWYRRA